MKIIVNVNNGLIWLRIFDEEIEFESIRYLTKEQAATLAGDLWKACGL